MPLRLVACPRVLQLSKSNKIKIPAPRLGSGQVLPQRTREGRGTLRLSFVGQECPTHTSKPSPWSDNNVRPTRAVLAEVAEHYEIGVIDPGAADCDLLAIGGYSEGSDPKRLGVEVSNLRWLAAIEWLVKKVGA